MIFDRLGRSGIGRRRLDRRGRDHREGVELAPADPVGELQGRGGIRQRARAGRRHRQTGADQPAPGVDRLLVVCLDGALECRIERAGPVDDREGPRLGVHPLGHEKLQPDRQPHDDRHEQEPDQERLGADQRAELGRRDDPDLVQVRTHGRGTPAQSRFPGRRCGRRYRGATAGRPRSAGRGSVPSARRAGPGDRPATAPPGRSPGR